MENSKEGIPNETNAFECLNKIKRYQCQKCPFQTNSKTNLMQHIDSVHDLEVIYRCPFCAAETYSEDCASQHDLFAECASKTKRDITEEDLNLNKTDNTGSYPTCSLTQDLNRSTDQWIQCSNCLTKCKTLVTFQKHVNMQHINSLGQYKYFCKHCKFNTAWRESLENHISSQHPLIAEIQWSQFNQKENLGEHKLQSQPKEINWFKCDSCGYQSRRKSNLDTHISRKHTDPAKIQWFQCDKCPSKFKRKQILRFHVKFRHPDALLYNCKHCTSQFENNVSLQKHLTYGECIATKIE